MTVTGRLLADVAAEPNGPERVAERVATERQTDSDREASRERAESKRQPNGSGKIYIYLFVYIYLSGYSIGHRLVIAYPVGRRSSVVVIAAIHKVSSGESEGKDERDWLKTKI